jgi:hypothetical protein
MSRYRPRTQQPPPPPPTPGYRSLRTADTSSTTGTGAAPRSESTKGAQVSNDGFVPIEQDRPPTRRRSRPRLRWSKKDVVEVASLIGTVGVVIVAAVTLIFRLGSVEEKIGAVGGDVTTVKETQISDHAKLEEVRSDVVELRRDVRDLRDTPEPTSQAVPPTGKPKYPPSTK